MKREWVTISAEEFREGIARTYKMEPHHPITMKGIPWMVCQKCGLVYVANRFTRWAIGRGCFNRLHPDHEAQRTRARRW